MMTTGRIVKALPPHLRRKVEKVAENLKISPSAAVVFCLQRCLHLSADAKGGAK